MESKGNDEELNANEWDSDTSEEVEEKEELESTPEKDESNEEMKGVKEKENKILGVIIVSIILFFIAMMGVMLINNSLKNFNYNKLDFDILKEGDVKFFHTSFVIYEDNKKTDYNVFLRNDPRLLRLVPFEGEFNQKEVMVLNFTQEFNCDGDGIIAVANMAQIYRALGTESIKDVNATCDEQGRYMFVRLQEGNSNKIEQFGPSCYNLNINNCDILKVTERFTLEGIDNFK